MTQTISNNFKLRKILHKIRSVFPKKDKEFEVANDFLNSKLGGKSLLFTNNVGLILLRDVENDWDCISDVIGSVRDCRECIPKDALIKFSGIQLIVETKEDISSDTVNALENFGFMFQHTSVPCTEGEIYCSTFFLQDSNSWSKDFEDFLRTYPDFLSNRFKAMQIND